MPDLSVERGGADDLESLAPLWLAIHARHVASMPELAPYVTDAESWAARRELYASVLARPGTILLLARVDGELVGYGLAHTAPRGETLVADTWVTGPLVGEIESLGVLPAFRGTGIGSAMLDELERALADAGVNDVVISVLPGNAGAMELYRRRGYLPTLTYVTKLAGRPAV